MLSFIHYFFSNFYLATFFFFHKQLGLIHQTGRDLASAIPHLNQIVRDAREYQVTINSEQSRAAREVLNDVTHLLCSIQIVSSPLIPVEPVSAIAIEEDSCRFQRDYIVYNTLMVYLKKVKSKLLLDIDTYSHHSFQRR